MEISAHERGLIFQSRIHMESEIGPLRDQLEQAMQRCEDISREKRYTDGWNKVLVAELRKHEMMVPNPPYDSQFFMSPL